MKNPKRIAVAIALSILVVATVVSCRTNKNQEKVWPITKPLGDVIDRMNQQQEVNAESTKFTIYMHEFELNRLDEDGQAHGYRLNSYGEDHVKQIAMQLLHGDYEIVVIERSDTSARQDTTFQFPVHFNDDLDRQRRKVVVAALELMGVADADRRVVVAPAAAEGLNSDEAASASASSARSQVGAGGRGGFGFGIGGF